jgi:ribose-phosphate pyrophosphokinase
MIDSAGAVTSLASRIHEAGAVNIYAVASHGVFTGGAMNRIEQSYLKRICVNS